MAATSNSPLSQLQSKAQVELLDAVDKLRADGFSGELDLPQLIVCGDQSSGKSSVLEAISQVRFPAADIFCTRFASELVLRTAPTRSFSVTLIPAAHRTDEEKAHIASFQAPEDLTDPQDFPRIVVAAGKFIDDLKVNGLEPEAFYQDKLRAVIYGPDLPPLTLVDLPGLIHASSRDQGTQDIAIVKEITESYMRQESSIILAVISAEVNLANQEVLELSRRYDQQGRRTLGIITKPDKVEAGSPSEDAGILCAQNQKISLGLGWHVLKNRGGHQHRNDSSEERDADETKFFSSSRWAEIPDESRGIGALRQRLSSELLRSVTKDLPTLFDSIKERTAACEDNLHKLGEPKDSEYDQRLQLTKISYKVDEIVKSSVEGHYNGSFFHGPSIDTTSVRKLRSRLREILDEFSNHMQDRGKFYTFKASEERGPRSNHNASFAVVPSITDVRHRPFQVSVEEAVQAADDYIKENRGCEPSGFPPLAALAHMFIVQSSPWETIAQHYIEKCWLAGESFIVQVLEAVAPEHIAHAILDVLVNSRLATIRSNLASKLEELLKPYQKGRLITLDTGRSLKRVGDSLSLENPLTEGYVAWRALEYLEVYYSIAVTTFAETVATLAIENCLVEGLLEIFTPMAVMQLGAGVLRNLTAEPERIANLRTYNKKRLNSLKSISSVISRHYHGSRALGYQNHSHIRASSKAPEVRIDSANSSSSPSDVPGVLTPPRTPDGKASRMNSSDRAPLAATVSPGSNSADTCESPHDPLEGDAKPRQILPRRRAKGAARYLANQSPASRTNTPDKAPRRANPGPGLTGVTSDSEP